MGNITVTKKVLNVIGNTVKRTYGNLLKDQDYALSIDGFNGFNDAMQAELDGKVTITDSQDTIQNSQDTGIITVGDEKRTKNKETYEWQAGVKLDGSLTGNYEFQNDGVSSTTTTVHGKSNVLARKVYLNDINANLTYGSSDAINDHINGVVSIKDLASAIVYGDNVKLADGAVVNVKDGSEYAVNKGERNTADADTYADSLKIDNAALTGDASKLGNYELVNNATGSIKVDQAEMHVKLNGVERTYGNKALINGTSYGVNGLTGNVNGDNYGVGDVKVTVNSDGAVDGVSGSKVTNNVGAYTWSGTVTTDNAGLNKNYKLELKGDGVSKVEKATLNFVVDDKIITQNVPAEYTCTAKGLANGDTLAGIGVGGYELDSSVNPLIIGVYEDKIGVLINGSLHLTGSDSLLQNYRVEIDPGTLTVLIGSNPNDYWFGAAPWDKERNLRERKAEFHYVAGGMSV